MAITVLLNVSFVRLKAPSKSNNLSCYLERLLLLCPLGGGDFTVLAHWEDVAVGGACSQ